MKPGVILMLIIFFALNADAQKILSFKPLRYDEDYSFLRKDSSNNWYKKTKYSSVGKNRNAYISFGGEIRFQYFNVKNEKWGDLPKDKDGYFFTRFLPHVDFHAGKHFRTFVQLQSSTANGKTTTTPVDENPLEAHQAFVDYNIFPTHKSQLTFRLGRQELYYGSQRIIAVRDGPNNRQSFDGLKSMFTTASYKLDLFYTHFVAAQKGIFDDGFNKDVKFWGAYVIKNRSWFSSNIDLYYLGLWKRNAIFDDGQARELRHSIGSRIWGNKGNWKYDAEGLYQFGKFGDKTISAWTGSLNAAYTFNKPKLHPQVSLKAEFISGDAHLGDNKLQTFNPLFPRGSYFGLASLIGPANLIDIHPSLLIKLAKQLGWNIDCDAFFRYSNNDGIYGPNVALIYSGKNTNAQRIGKQLSTDFTYTPNDYLYFRTEFTWFDAGKYLKEAGSGKDIWWMGLTAQLRF
ncbi:MAG: alginate export family protein [Ferruginibacter sp.]